MKDRESRQVEYAHDVFRREVAALLRKEGVDCDALEVPPENIDADLALPAFALAKSMKKAPAVIAKELEGKLKVPAGSLVREVRAEGPYLNFWKDDARYFKMVLGDVLKAGDAYGWKARKKEKVMIEYSQANTHKAFHVGHVRGTSLGESLARIMRAEGYSVIQANYQGDTGAHVAKWLWCYLKYHKGEAPPRNGGERWIASIYVEAVKRLDEKPEFQGEVEKVNYDLENGKDRALTGLWKKTRVWSLRSLDEVYKDLDAHFDRYFFEREMEERGREISCSLIKKGIARMDGGAVIVDLGKYGLGVWVLLRKDGTTLYSAKDVALAEKKFREFEVDRSIYVIGAAQSLHMRQLFKTLELMRFRNAGKCFHLAYSEVRLPSGKMSSRTGENILYDDMKKELFCYAEEEVRKRHPEWSAKEVEKSVRNISIGALKFGMLNQGASKLIVFDPREAMNFEGDTGPYVQYTHARAYSILKNAKVGCFDASLLKEKEERVLVAKLSYFPRVVREACEGYDPSGVAAYLLEVAHDFNTFYHRHPVLKAEKGVREARLALVFATMQVVRNGLFLLGIGAPKRM